MRVPFLPPLATHRPAFTSLAASLYCTVCAGAPPGSGSLGDAPLPLGQSNNGISFTVRLSAIRPHPLGHLALIHGHSARLRPLDATEQGSPRFRSVESTWVVACHAGTYSIVQDRFLDEHGDTVAVTSESPYDQEVPEPGSVAAAVFHQLCRYIAQRRAKEGGGP